MEIIYKEPNNCIASQHKIVEALSPPNIVLKLNKVSIDIRFYRQYPVIQPNLRIIPMVEKCNVRVK